MWQPIETAPKDRFLLLCGPSGYTTTPRVFATGCMYSDYHVGRWVDHANDDLSDWGFEPTHWMPLPELPVAQPAPSVPTDVLYRLGAAHDACLDGDHRACRDTITQLMCDIGPDGAVPEPKP